MNILLIEPNAQLAKVYSQYLASQKNVVAVSHDAQGAVHMIDSAVPDVIVLELQLSQHGGIEFLHELRSYPEWKDIPIVLHTMVPHDRLGLSDNLRRSLGIVGYFYKPTTSLAQLKSGVEQAVE